MASSNRQKITKFEILVVRKVGKNERPKSEPQLKRQKPRVNVKIRESDCTEISLGVG